MFINLSSDKVEIFIGGNNIVLEKNKLEKQLPTLLNNILKQTSIKNIYILNGPGSFTTIRV
jgi:tRNA A37 threonylcarbamoyladenosine modification protein TsaB